MNKNFGMSYADAYDQLYQDKNYPSECDLIERIFRTYSDSVVESVLDLGCGTGNHAIPLAQRGYEVVGVDRSEDMLARARQKAANRLNGKQIVFLNEDLTKVDLNRNFDAVAMMFAVLGYQLHNSDVLSALKASRRHLRVGGLFLFDVWYGPAVLHQRPTQRLKVIPTANGQILRASSGELDLQRQVCTVCFHVWTMNGDRLVSEIREDHAMRYFFPMELHFIAEQSGLELLRLGAFPDFDRSPDETTWNVLGVARAV